MIIQKIEVSGHEKRSAVLIFVAGLNVIAGASDTGKSYVIQCLQFVLGASKLPKPIKESRGYEQVEVTFFDAEDGVFSVKRKLEEGAETILTRASDSSVLRLKGKHRKGFENFSNRFLRKFSLHDKLLLKSKENLTTQSLSLRTFENVLIVDETRIVAAYSPLGTGQRGEQTLELSMLRALLTGADDSGAKVAKGSADSQGTINKKISILEELIESLYPAESFTSVNRIEIEKEVLEVERKISAADEEFLRVSATKHAFVESRTAKLRQLSYVNDERAEQLLLIDRFSLLERKYRSNSERLGGIVEASSVLDEFSVVECPICSGELHEKSANEIDILIDGAAAELKKTELHIQDLQDALVGIKNKLIGLDQVKSTLDSEIKGLDFEISFSLHEAVNQNSDSKIALYGRKERANDLISRLDSRDLALKQVESLRKFLGQESASYAAENFERDISELEGAISSLLERWGFPGDTGVDFSLKDRDILIGGVPRAHFGKGYRAVAFSAFIIGLMAVLKARGRHPGFIVLDSPLTTYKKADQERGENDESIENDMVYSLYRDLCDSYSNDQIIIFDNQEPEPDLLTMMHYTHFSKNTGVGRYGFFPVVGS